MEITTHSNSDQILTIWKIEFFENKKSCESFDFPSLDIDKVGPSHQQCALRQLPIPSIQSDIDLVTGVTLVLTEVLNTFEQIFISQTVNFICSQVVAITLI